MKAFKEEVVPLFGRLNQGINHSTVKLTPRDKKRTMVKSKE